jgi:hypothetical protein
MSKVSAISGESGIPVGLSLAIQEQQARMWKLRSLLDAVCSALQNGNVEDEGAAVQGLIDYADEIHGSLDVGALKQRAEAIMEDDSGEKRP